MKANFDSTVSLELNSILEGEEYGQTQTGQSKSSAPEGSREATSSSRSKSASRTHQEALQATAKYYNGFNDGGRYV